MRLASSSPAPLSPLAARRLGNVGAGLTDQTFAYPDEIVYATRVATAQLNARARRWIWGRAQPKHRSHRRRFIHTL